MPGSNGNGDGNGLRQDNVDDGVTGPCSRPPPRRAVRRAPPPLLEWERQNKILLEEKEKKEKERRDQIILEANEFKKREAEEFKLNLETSRDQKREREEKIASIEKRKGKKGKGKKPGNVVVQATKPVKLTDKALTLLLKMPSSPRRWGDDDTRIKHLRLQTKGVDEEIPFGPCFSSLPLSMDAANLKHTPPLLHVELPTPPAAAAAAAAKDGAKDLACKLLGEDAKPEVGSLSLLEDITKGFSNECKIGSGGNAWE